MGAAVEPAQIGSGCQPYMIGRRVSGDRCVTGGGQGIFASSIGVPAATRNATGTARACGAARSPWAIPATANEPGARSAARPGRPSWAAVSMGHLALKRAIRHAEPTTWSAATSRPWSIPQGPGRPPVQVPHLRPGGSGYHRRQDPARHGTAPRPKRRPRAARADVRLYRAKSAVRAPDRGGRALRWQHVDLDGDPAARPAVPPHVAVWRSVRGHGETKTERSRRTLGLHVTAVQALRTLSDSQARERLAAGADWQDTGLVFTTHTAPRWTQETSGRCSNASATRPASGTAGHRASCGPHSSA